MNWLYTSLQTTPSQAHTGFIERDHSQPPSDLICTWQSQHSARVATVTQFQVPLVSRTQTYSPSRSNCTLFCLGVLFMLMSPSQLSDHMDFWCCWKLPLQFCNDGILSKRCLWDNPCVYRGVGTRNLRLIRGSPNRYANVNCWHTNGVQQQVCNIG